MKRIFTLALPSLLMSPADVTCGKFIISVMSVCQSVSLFTGGPMYLAVSNEMGWLVHSVHVVGMGVIELGYIVHKSIDSQVLGPQSKGVLVVLKVYKKYETYWP